MEGVGYPDRLKTELRTLGSVAPVRGLGFLALGYPGFLLRRHPGLYSVACCAGLGSVRSPWNKMTTVPPVWSLGTMPEPRFAEIPAFGQIRITCLKENRLANRFL
jgi:hypothetical protein